MDAPDSEDVSDMISVHEDGRLEGRQESLRDLLTLHLQGRFGTLSESFLDKVRRLDEKEGIDLGLRLIHAESMDQLEL